MEHLRRQINLERQGDIFCVSLRRSSLDEADIVEMGEEVVGLIVDQGCRNLVFNLGNEAPAFLYSLFLAKLIMIRRRLVECGGAMKLCEVPPRVFQVFEATGMAHLFDFLPSKQEAVAVLMQRAAPVA